MARKILFIALVTITVGFMGMQLSGLLMNISVANAQAQESRPVAQRISKATVLITMYGPETPQPVLSDEHTVTYQMDRGRGLGTLVSVDGQTLIITHDHWSLLDAQLGQVEFHNTDGELLAEMSGQVFRQYIRHRDGGTMVLKAPASVANASSPATPHEAPASLAPGATVEVVRRASGPEREIVVMKAVVEAIEMKYGVPAFSLRSLDGTTIVPGDSGGGIWYEGKLVGNMWTTVNEQVTVTEKRLWVTQTNTYTENDGSKAAVLCAEHLESTPAPLASKLAPQSNMSGGPN